MNQQDKIDALWREHSGYKKRGLPDRVDAVEDELRKLGAMPPKPRRAEKKAQ